MVPKDKKAYVDPLYEKFWSLNVFNNNKSQNFAQT